jgi:hypothetical protein
MNLEKIKEKLKKIQNPQAGGGSENFLKLEDGENLVRFLPYESKQPLTEGLFYTETKTHQIEENGQTKYVHCPRHQDSNAHCPICQLYWDLWKASEAQGSEELKKIARSLKPRLRYYANVLDKSTDEVKILSYGVKLQEKVLEFIASDDFGDITDPKTGNDFKIVKKMVDKFPNYDSSMPVIKKTEIPEDQFKSYMEKAHEIENCVKIQDEESLQKLADVVMVKAASVIDNLVSVSSDDEAPFEESSGESFQSHLDSLKKK